MNTKLDRVDHSLEAVPFRAGFIVGDFANLGSLRLAGSRCKRCGIALFGQRHRCENCASSELDHVEFARTGTIHSFTVQRYAPPPSHSLPVTPWHPRPVAWVDLDDHGPRILAPLACAPEQVAIGMAVAVRCHIAWADADGHPVVAYGFAPFTSEEVVS